MTLLHWFFCIETFFLISLVSLVGIALSLHRGHGNRTALLVGLVLILLSQLLVVVAAALFVLMLVETCCG